MDKNGTTVKQHIILCGLGKVGFSVLEALHSLQETVIVIAREVNPDWARSAEQWAARLIIADAREEEALREAGIEQARAVILATNDDLTNLTLALTVRRLSPQTAVVLRLSDLELAEQARRDLNVRAVFNAAALSAPAFVAAALGEDVVGAFPVEHANVNIARLRITEERRGLSSVSTSVRSRLVTRIVSPCLSRYSTPNASWCFCTSLFAGITVR